VAATVGRRTERRKPMTQQKSENRVVPEGRGNSTQTRGVKHQGGGKAIPVRGKDRQLELTFGTTENPRVERGVGREERKDLSGRKPRTASKPKSKARQAGPATMEEVIERLEEAFTHVAANKGAPGPDGQTIEQVQRHLPDVLTELRKSLIDGTYQPGDIRRVWIPKSGGGRRGLGIPDVVDRMVQEAVRMVLEPLYEPTFHESSHGFRQGRGCQTAIAEAKSYVEEGYDRLVDLDLEKFFDLVNQQRLMARLGEIVKDQRVLVLIRRMLKAKVVLPDGVKVATEEGLPQGGPLSPLLSNIVLSELDEELARRGLRFVRYADDANIYVKSERAAHRVMASVTRFIEKRLRLKVNPTKSAVARPQERHFLGYRLHRQENGHVDVLLSERSETRLQTRIREMTPRAGGRALDHVIKKVNEYLTGWLGHFKVCTDGIARVVRDADAHIRRRLRAVVLKHWKRRRTVVRRLIGLGSTPRTVRRRIYEGRKSIWALSRDWVVQRTLGKAYFADRGFESLLARFEMIWAERPAPRQLRLFAVPRRP
jgi:RNA-directed DNA polymerase